MRKNRNWKGLFLTAVLLISEVLCPLSALADGPGTSATGTYSAGWKQTEAGWQYQNRQGVILKKAWLCDNAIPANELNIWYFLDENGLMVTDRFVSAVYEGVERFYYVNQNHDGYFGSLEFKDGIYDAGNGTGIFLRFSRTHDNTFASIQNPDAVSAIKAFGYRSMNFASGNGDLYYTANDLVRTFPGGTGGGGGGGGHTHTFGNETVIEAATCGKEGLKSFTCTGCGAVRTEVIPKLSTHTYGEETVIKDATCQNPGIARKICTVCGAVSDRATDLLPHTYGEWKTVTEASCLSSGLETCECIYGCGAQKVRILDPLEHTFGEWKTVTEPTCTASGLEVSACENGCGTEKTRITEPTGHAFGAWETEKEPACTASGLEVSTCENGCGTKKTRITDPVGHTFGEEPTEEVEAGCTSYGYRTYTCESCGEEKTELLSPTGHAFSEESTVITEATCTETGISYVECTKCGEKKYTFTEPLGHAYEDDVCTRCGAISPNHECTFDPDTFDVILSPTCTAPGLKRYTCAICSETKDEEIPKTGHSYGAWETEEEPTCFAFGLQKRTCENDGCDAAEYEKIAKTEHALSDWAVTEDPTCTVAGIKERHCENDGCTYSEYDTVPATGHTFGEWQVAVEPTCESTGIERRSCIHCSAEEGRITEKTEHVYPETGRVLIEATCGKSGMTAYECEGCGRIYLDEENPPATGLHTFSVWVADPDGIHKTRTCSVCHKKETALIGGLTVTLSPERETYEFENGSFLLLTPASSPEDAVFTVSSSNESVFTAAVLAGGTIQLTGVGKGTATLTVNAVSEDSLSRGELTVSVSVTGPVAGYTVCLWDLSPGGKNDLIFGPAIGDSYEDLYYAGNHTHCISTDSWAVIAENVKNGHADYYTDCLSEGCTKVVPLSGYTSDKRASVLPGTAWNATATNAGGYPASAILSSVDALYDQLTDADLKAAITERSVSCPAAWESTPPYTVTESRTATNLKFWLLSTEEIFDVNAYPTASTGWTDYGTRFQKSMLMNLSYLNARYATVYDQNGESQYYWLRTPDRTGTKAIAVTDLGELYSRTATTENGICPGFVIAP